MHLEHIKKFSLQNLRRINGNRGYFKIRGAEDEKEINPPKIYELAQINLFIGRNGSGKSTILDMVNCIRAPGTLGSMPRENMTNQMHSYFELIGDSFVCRVDFPSSVSLINKFKYGVSEYQTANIAIQFNNNTIQYLGEFNKFTLTKSSFEAAFSVLPVQICHSNDAIEVKNLQRHHIDELNKISTLLKGTLGGDIEERKFIIEMRESFKSKNSDNSPDFEFIDRYQKAPIILLEEGDAIGYYAGDDESQWQNVVFSKMPSGWLAYAKIAGWLSGDEIKAGSICLIEEPEVHLHPSLQRALINRLNEIAVEKNLQLLIASHSPLFLNMASLQSNTKLYGVDARNQLEEITVPKALLKDLGVKGSDILQANGVIWVEGESDKIYLNHWISKILEKRKINYPLDYEICEYGGANLGHFGNSEDRQFTQLQRMNQNFLVLFDKDSDFHISCDGEPTLINESSYKARIWKELVSNTNIAIVTDTYTIEGYLPKEFFDNYFEYSGEKIIRKKQYSKVEIARIFKSQNIDLKSHQFTDKLIHKLNQIVDTLIGWNS